MGVPALVYSCPHIPHTGHSFPPEGPRQGYREPTGHTRAPAAGGSAGRRPGRPALSQNPQPGAEWRWRKGCGEQGKACFLWGGQVAGGRVRRGPRCSLASGRPPVAAAPCPPEAGVSKARSVEEGAGQRPQTSQGEMRLHDEIRTTGPEQRHSSYRDDSPPPHRRRCLGHPPCGREGWGVSSFLALTLVQAAEQSQSVPARSPPSGASGVYALCHLPGAWSQRSPAREFKSLKNQH